MQPLLILHDLDEPHLVDSLGGAFACITTCAVMCDVHVYIQNIFLCNFHGNIVHVRDREFSLLRISLLFSYFCSCS